MSLVVDASIALKWFLLDEPLASQAIAAFENGGNLIASDFLIAKMCNGAWRSTGLGRISRAQVDEIATGLRRFFDKLVSAARLPRRASAIAGQLDHPVYDCSYLALAEAEQANLVTADLRLADKVRGTTWEQIVVHLGSYDPGSPDP